MEKVKRLDYVDVCRFLGISLIIFSHITVPNKVLQWLCAFNVPCFFLLSGFCYRLHNFDKEFVLKKIKTIYVPFVLFAMIYCQGGLSSWVYIFYGSGMALELGGTSIVLWFLPCFFTAVIIFSLMMNVCNRLKHKVWILIAGVAVMLVGAKVCEILKGAQPMLEKYGYPLSFDMAMVGVVLMTAGYYIRPIFDWLGVQRQWMLMLIAIVFFVITSYTVYLNLPESLNPSCAHVEMAMGSIGNYTLFFCNALLMSMALIGLAMLIDKWLKNKVLLLYIGRNTLSLLCVHVVLLLGVSKMFSLMGLEYESAEMMILQGIVTYVIVIIVSIPVIMIIRRFIPNMVGQ